MKPIRRFTIVSVLASCAAPVSPVVPSATPTGSAPRAATESASIVDPIELAARVNGEPITRAEFDAEVLRLMRRYQAGGHQLPASIEVRVRESVLTRMIDDALVAHKASQLDLAVTDQELLSAFEERKSRFRIEQAFTDYLSRAHTTEAQFRADLYRGLLRELVVAHLSGQVEVSDTEMRSYFDDNRTRFVDREQAKASRILIRVPRDARSDRVREARDLARKIQKEASRAPETFADLARLHSHGPQASRGGDLGWFGRGRMPPEWDEVAFTLKPGNISKPVRTDGGFEIIAVWDRRSERDRSFEEVADNIRATLKARKTNEKRRSVMRDLEAESEIEILIDSGEAESATDTTNEQ